MAVSLEQKIGAGFVFALVLLLGVGFISYWSTTNLLENDDRVVHTHEILETLERLLSLMTDAETGQRGYLITGDERFLEPYALAVARIHDRIKRTRELMAGSSRQQQQLDTFESLISQRIAFAGDTIDLRRAQGFRAIQGMIQSGQGRQITDQIRQLVAGMQAEEKTALSRQRQRATASAETTLKVILGGSLLALILFGLAGLVNYYDLMRRRQAVASLQESETRFRQVTENIREVFWLTDPTMKRVYYVNPVYETIWGRSCESLYTSPRSWLEAIHPADRERVMKTAELKLGSGADDYDEVFRIVRPDGSVRWIRDRAFPIRNPAGSVRRIAGISEDITVRKEIEETLRETNEKLTALIDSSPIAITILNADGDCQLWNPAAERMFGWRADEVIGLPLPTIPPDRKEEHRAFRERVLRGEGFTEFEVIRHRKDGSSLTVNLWTAPLRDATGTVRGIMGLLADMTERKQTEEALLQQAQILDQIHESVISTDLKGYITSWNKGAERLFGYQATQALGRPIVCVFPDEESGFLDHHVIGPLHTKGRHEMEILMRRKNGEGFDAHLSLSLLKRLDGTLTGTICYAMDITERKMAEERLKRSHKQLRALAVKLQEAQEQEQKRIGREIHDELGQALTGMKFELVWLGKQLVASAGRVPPSVVIKKVQFLIDVVDNTVELVRRIATTLRPSALDDLGLVAALEWQVREFQRKTGVRCRLQVNPQLGRIDMDRSSAIFRIVQEALTNVARHAHATSVVITLKENQRVFFLEVCDNGKGITEEELNGSTALGLLGIRERAAVFDGKINISGKSGAGTTVTVTIPLSS